MFTVINFVYPKETSLGFQILPLSIGPLRECSGTLKVQLKSKPLLSPYQLALKTQGHSYPCL